MFKLKKILPFLFLSLFFQLSFSEHVFGFACSSAQKQLIDGKRALSQYGFLGNAKADYSYIVKGQGCVRDYASGSIYAYNGKAYVVYGLIKQRYDQIKTTDSFLGYPLSDEQDTPDKTGRYNTFEYGVITWHPQRGVFEIHGDIYLKWKALGEFKMMGWPLTDESTTPDKIGRYNHFQNGSIYWHPCAGAFEVHGLIKNAWAQAGWEKSYLGYPLSDETLGPVNGSGIAGRYNRFQRGYLVWHQSYGTFPIQDQIYQIWKQDGGLSGKWGYPKSTAFCGPSYCSQQFEKGNLVYNFSHKGVDLRNEINARGIAIRNQGGRGTCSVQAMTFLLEYAYTQMCGDMWNYLSVEYANHAANKATGRTDDGDFFANIAAGYDKYGIIPNWRLPYNKDLNYNYDSMDTTIVSKDLEKWGYDLKGRFLFKGRFVKPNDGSVGLNQSQMDQILNYLDRGIPVAVGRSHSMVLVGYEKSTSTTNYPGGGRFLFRNSYGTGVGESGYQWEDFKSVSTTANDVYVYDIPGLIGFYPNPA